MVHVSTIVPGHCKFLDDSLEIRQIKNSDDPENMILNDLHEKLSDKYACIIDNKEEHKSEIKMG